MKKSKASSGADGEVRASHCSAYYTQQYSNILSVMQATNIKSCYAVGPNYTGECSSIQCYEHHRRERRPQKGEKAVRPVRPVRSLIESHPKQDDPEQERPINAQLGPYRPQPLQFKSSRTHARHVPSSAAKPFLLFVMLPPPLPALLAAFDGCFGVTGVRISPPAAAAAAAAEIVEPPPPK